MSYTKKYEIGSIRLDTPYKHYSYQFPLLSFGDVTHTVNLSLVFNSRLIGQNPFYMSNGFKLNLQKRIIMSNGRPSKYEDGDGTQVSLINLVDNILFDDDSQRIIRWKNGMFILENPDFSTETYNSSGQIISISDKYGETYLTYTYASAKLTSISYRTETKVVNLSYNNAGVISSVEFVCNGESVYEVDITYSDSNGITVNHPSGVNYYHSYSNNKFTAYSGQENATYSHKVECEEGLNCLIFTRNIGTKEVDKTTYKFFDVNSENKFTAVNITNFNGVITRVQYKNDKPCYSYEVMDVDEDLFENIFFEEEYEDGLIRDVYKGAVSLISNEVIGTQGINDGIKLKYLGASSNNWSYAVPNSHSNNYSGVVRISGWIAPMGETSCTVYAKDIFTGEEFGEYTINNLIPDIWNYFSFRCYMHNPREISVYLNCDISGVITRDIRITFEEETNGNYGSNHFIGIKDVLIKEESNGEKMLFYFDNGISFYNGNSLIPDVFTVNDILKYKINQEYGMNKNEIYYNNCRGIITDAGELSIKYIDSNNEVINLNVCDLAIGKVYYRGDKVNSEMTNFYELSGSRWLQTKYWFNDEYYKHIAYDSHLDVAEEIVEEKIISYERNSKGLVITETLYDTVTKQAINRSYTYDLSNTYLDYTINEFGVKTKYTTDPKWGIITGSCVFDENEEEIFSVSDNFDDDGTSLLSRTFNGIRQHTINYFDNNPNAIGITNGALVENPDYLFTYSFGNLSTVDKYNSSVEGHVFSNDDKTLTSSYPAVNPIYTTQSTVDNYGRTISVDNISNTYDTDPTYSSSGNYEIVGIDNSSGKLATSTDNTTGNVTKYAYEKNRVSKIGLFNSAGTKVSEESFTYDDIGRCVSDDYIYDVVNSKSIKDEITYCKSSTDPMADNRISTYTYRLLNGENVEKEVQTAYTYDGYKRVSTKSSTLDTNPFVKTFNYDKTRINSVSDKFSSSNKGTNSYTYDDYGRIVTDTYTSETTNNYGKYTYDSFGQLVREDNQALDKTFIYEYNGIGNITKAHTCPYTTGAISEDDYASTVEYKYTNTTHPDRLTNFNGKSIIYNSIGYPTNYDGKTWTWNDGKLTRIHKGSESQPGSKYENCTFTYDGYGRRIRKHYVYDPNPAVAGDGHYYYTTNYSYDESDRLVKEYITEYRDTGVTTTRELVYLYDASGIIGVSYSVNGGTPSTYYYRKNAQGDVTAIYDANGNRRAEYAYDAWGNCKMLYGASTLISGINPIRYRGYYFDRETGLYYLNARYYNPEWRRFISPDDTGYLDPVSVNGLNLYSYANNNPIGIGYCSFDINRSTCVRMANSFKLDRVTGAGNYLSGSNGLSIEFPSQNWLSLGIDLTAGMSGALSVLGWSLRNPKFYEFWYSAYGISKYEMLSNLKSPMTKIASVISYGLVAYDTYTDVMGHINAGDSWQTATASGIVTAVIGTFNVWASAKVGAALGTYIGGVPGFLIGTVAGVAVGIVINGVFYTEINGKSIAGYIEGGIEWFLEWIS